MNDDDGRPPEVHVLIPPEVLDAFTETVRECLRIFDSLSDALRAQLVELSALDAELEKVWADA